MSLLQVLPEPSDWVVRSQGAAAVGSSWAVMLELLSDTFRIHSSKLMLAAALVRG